MLSPHNALAGALRASPGPRPAPRRALVLGGAGALGAAVLEQLLSSHRFERVGVLANTSLQPALRGLHVVADDAAALTAFAADTALIVFDRERHANGRDAAFARAQPGDLPRHAQALLQAGVHSLIVVVPHAPALLPQALKLGLANLDEGAVAALGFTQLVYMRMAQDGVGAAPGELSPPQGLAAWMLSQLRWMVPQREQAVRVDTVARVAAALAVALPAVAPGTRVLPPELLWQAAQGATPPADIVSAWLGGKAVSPGP
jgi:hypothetical protein